MEMPKMPECTFCQIIAGALPASMVYEDGTVLAFMNQRQANPGHVLVIPRQHIETIFDLDDIIAAQLFRGVSRMARAIRKSLQPVGLTIFQANGTASSQEILHIHIHLFPRRHNDGYLCYYPKVPPICPRSELDRLASLITSKIEDTQKNCLET